MVPVEVSAKPGFHFWVTGLVEASSVKRCVDLRERLITRWRRVTKLWCLCWSGVCCEFEDHFGRLEVERSDDVAVGRLLGSMVCRNVPAGPV